MNARTPNLARCRMRRTAKGQAMTEFVFMAFVAFIVLFVAIQMAALGREAMALGQLNYQVTRWATDPGNNSLKDANGNAVNSPQCADVAKLIAGTTRQNIFPMRPAGGDGYMGKIGYGWQYRLRKPTSRRNWRRDELHCCRRHDLNTLRRAKAGWHRSAGHTDHGHSSGHFFEHFDHQSKFPRNSVPEDPVQYPDDADSVEASPDR